AKSPEDDAVDGRVLEHQIRCDSQGGGISQPVEKRRAQPCRRAERRALSQVVDEKPCRDRDGAREAYQHSLQEYPFSTHGSLPLEAPLEAAWQKNSVHSLLESPLHWSKHGSKHGAKPQIPGFFRVKGPASSPLTSSL